LNSFPNFIAATGLRAIATCLGQLNDIWAASPYAAAPVDRHQWFAGSPDAITPALWEAAIGAAVSECKSPERPPDFAGWTQTADRPLALYRFLAQDGRACALVDRTTDDPFSAGRTGRGTNGRFAWRFLDPFCPGLCQRPGRLGFSGMFAHGRSGPTVVGEGRRQ